MNNVIGNDNGEGIYKIGNLSYGEELLFTDENCIGRRLSQDVVVRGVIIASIGEEISRVSVRKLRAFKVNAVYCIPEQTLGPDEGAKSLNRVIDMVKGSLENMFRTCSKVIFEHSCYPTG